MTTQLRPAGIPEPMPVAATGPTATEIVFRSIEDYTRHHRWDLDTIDQLKLDLAARLELGVQKYGHPLRPENGRNHLNDAYQEQLDGLHYMACEIAKREKTEGRAALMTEYLVYQRMIEIALTLRDLIGMQAQQISSTVFEGIGSVVLYRNEDDIPVGITRSQSVMAARPGHYWRPVDEKEAEALRCTVPSI